MPNSSSIVPPQPRRRIVTRRVNAHRFSWFALESAICLLAAIYFHYEDLIA